MTTGINETREELEAAWAALPTEERYALFDEVTIANVSCYEDAEAHRFWPIVLDMLRGV